MEETLEYGKARKSVKASETRLDKLYYIALLSYRGNHHFPVFSTFLKAQTFTRLCPVYSRNTINLIAILYTAAGPPCRLICAIAYREMLTKFAAFVKNSTGSRDRRSQPPLDVDSSPTPFPDIQTKRKSSFFGRRRSQRMSCPPKPRGAHDVAFALHEKLLASDHGSNTDDGDRPTSLGSNGWGERDVRSAKSERASLPVTPRRNAYGTETDTPVPDSVAPPLHSRQQKYLSTSTLPLLQALDKQLEPYIVRSPEDRRFHADGRNGM